MKSITTEDFQTIVIPLKRKVCSLCWRGDQLIDWVAGGTEYSMDGTVRDPYMTWDFDFDSAVQSSSGRYAAIFERLGTRAVLLCEGKLLRELTRDEDQAEVFEFPIAFIRTSNGRELLIHSPKEYCRLEIEDAATGELLTLSDDRKCDDFYHSRLVTSPDGKWLLSAGWFWHPSNDICLFDIERCLTDPALLDRAHFPSKELNGEVNSAAWIDNLRILLASSPDADRLWRERDGGLQPGHVGVFNLESEQFELLTALTETLGTVFPLNERFVIGFFEHPKLVDLGTGQVVHRWPELSTGKQNSSIIWGHDPVPPLALDPVHRRFAVADSEKITVVSYRDS